MTDEVKLLKTMIAHREYVVAGLNTFADELKSRGIVHDLSKMRDDEFDGFAAINGTARHFPYGSQEYKDSLERGKVTIDLHYSRNSHHPEFHGDESMSLFDVLEMTADWYSAQKVYNTTTWTETLIKQTERYGDTLTKAQWWVISEAAEKLEPYEDTALFKMKAAGTC